MPKYTTVKSTTKGKSATLAMRQVRAAKYAPVGTNLTRSGHVKAKVR
jgi:hypothetical protein